MKVRTRKLAAFVTCLGLAAAFPVMSSADKGGVPNGGKGNPNAAANGQESKPCPAKGKRKHKKPAPNTHGKKCGFAPGAPTTTTTPPTTTDTTSTTPTTTT